jgi:DNA sulfur modification protein DndD
MILTKLVMTDFGLFAGYHEFLLKPREEKDGPRPLILFGGANGAGKTTILEAVRLCLYGRDALGLRVSQAEYEMHLSKRTHKSRKRSADGASVALEFEYAQNGELGTYCIERSWVCIEQGVVEHLSLRKNGDFQFGLGPEFWQDFLKDLIPIGLADLFFFDGERIQSLADDSRGGQVLGSALKDLLGVNLIEQLEADLGVYLTRQARIEALSAAQEQLEALQQERRRLSEIEEAYEQDAAGVQTRLDRITNKIQEKQAEIVRAGGAFVEKRSAVEAQKKLLEVSATQLRNQLIDACADLLPFVLAPNLCRTVYSRIQKEEELEFRKTKSDILQTQADRLTEEIGREGFWHDVEAGIDTGMREAIGNRIRDLLLKMAATEEADVGDTFIHNLSSKDRRQLLGWLDQALSTVRTEALALVRELQNKQVELEQAERVLQAVPPTELIKPLLLELQAYQEEASRLKNELQAFTDLREKARTDLASIVRELEKIETALQENARQGDKGALAAKGLRVLSEFRRDLLRLKIADLESTFTEYFNRLARKQEFVSHVIINEKDFSMTLVSREGRYIPKPQLSAGEKQIYAVALLWALRSVAARPLPIIIDTPLGRLDSSHRQNLVDHYFPHASHQVVVLSTDTEIDAGYFSELEPHISHAYHLIYDDSTGTTQAEAGYFWEQKESGVLPHAS